MLAPSQQLHKLVDGFSVMTYDASRPDRPGFNAPLPWVENNIRLLVDADHAVEERAKIDKLDEEPEPCVVVTQSALAHAAVERETAFSPDIL